MFSVLTNRAITVIMIMMHHLQLINQIPQTDYLSGTEGVGIIIIDILGITLQKWYVYTKGEYMTQVFIFVLPPVAFVSITILAKYCVSRYSRYKEMELLLNSGVEHCEVTEYHVLF